MIEKYPLFFSYYSFFFFFLDVRLKKKEKKSDFSHGGAHFRTTLVSCQKHALYRLISAEVLKL